MISMKVRLNKRVFSDMDSQVATLVKTWAARYRKVHIRVVTTTTFYPGEDAHVTIVNLTSGAQQHERVAGEFAGLTRLSPTSEISLPYGCVAVVTGFFCGTP